MDFTGDDLRDARFEFVDLTGATFREATLDRVVMRGVEVIDLDIDGYIGKLVVNGVDVAPLVEAELDRRYPERPKMRPTDPAGYREAWEMNRLIDRGAIQRIQSNGKRGECRKWCSQYWLEWLNKHPGERYVSDGDPGRISIPGKLRGNIDPKRESQLIVY